MPSPYYYYVVAFDATYVEWVEVGSSPYLGAIDYPTNYIYLVPTNANKREGIFDFANSGVENAETLTKVYVEVYCKAIYDPDLGFPTLNVFVWDGSTWTQFNITPGSSWTWKSVDVSSKINSWAKLDSCRAYIRTSAYLMQEFNADCMRLKATTIIPVLTRAASSNIIPSISILLSCLRQKKRKKRRAIASILI